MNNTNEDGRRVRQLEKVAVRFSGDSGDGMQLAGNIFTNVSAGWAIPSRLSPTIRQKSVPRRARSAASAVSR